MQVQVVVMFAASSANQLGASWDWDEVIKSSVPFRYSQPTSEHWLFAVYYGNELDQFHVPL